MSSSPGSTDETPHAVNRRVTLLSVGVATVLILMKTYALAASGSVSVLASLADSALDLAASLGVFYAVRWAAEPPDAEHRYGHGKGEALAALVQSGFVAASGFFIGWEAVQRMINPQPVTAGVTGVVVMVLSILLTAWLVWMQTRALKKSGSLAVSADRAHYAADLAAGAVALIGLASGAFLDAPGLDAAAGLVVAIWLVWGALGLLRTAADQLLDRAASEAQHQAVRAAVLEDPAITGLHALRTRLSGSTLMVQMHVDIDGDLTLRDAHAIVEAAEGRIRAAFADADIIIHPDPRGSR